MKKEHIADLHFGVFPSEIPPQRASTEWDRWDCWHDPDLLNERIDPIRFTLPIVCLPGSTMPMRERAPHIVDSLYREPGLRLSLPGRIFPGLASANGAVAVVTEKFQPHVTIGYVRLNTTTGKYEFVTAYDF